MIIAKENPKGLDLGIKKLQYLLDSFLCNNIVVGQSWLGTVAIYGKVQKTTREGVTIPETFLSDNEYIQPFVDDTVSASIGFLVNSQTISNQVPLADVELIASVDLAKIYGTINRDESKCLLQVKNTIINSVIELGIVREGLNDVFRGFSGMKNYQPAEISNWFIFSINFKLLFGNWT